MVAFVGEVRFEPFILFCLHLQLHTGSVVVNAINDGVPRKNCDSLIISCYTSEAVIGEVFDQLCDF